VRDVSQSAVTMADLGDLPGTPQQPGIFRVLVTLDASAPADAALAWRQSLKAGMRVQASLVAEHRTLLQWALEPLSTLRVAAR